VKKTRLVIVAILFSGCSMLSGCLESSFQLSDASRLPVWIKLPPTVQRQDVSLTLNYYSVLFGPNAKLILKNRRGEVLEQLSGHDEPFGSLSEYPVYVLVVVNGVPEIIEHRKMEPVFYVSDDSAIRSKILHGQ